MSFVAGTSLATTNSASASISPQPFKPLSSETIKARPTNPTVEASICQNEDALSQCNTVNPASLPKSLAANRRGDEPEMKL
jgi:hypothetical protein